MQFASPKSLLKAKSTSGLHRSWKSGHLHSQGRCMHRRWLRKLVLKRPVSARLMIGSLILEAVACFPMAAKDDPVQWTLRPQSAAIAPGGTAIFELDAAIQPGWHLYSPTTPAGGPIITKIKLNDNPAIAAYRMYRPAPSRDSTRTSTLRPRRTLTKRSFSLKLRPQRARQALQQSRRRCRYQACSDVRCLNPVKKTASAEIRFDASGQHKQLPGACGYAVVPGGHAHRLPRLSIRPSKRAGFPGGQGLLPFLVDSIWFRLGGPFTPCVFPMIPITVSFFLNQRQAAPGQSNRQWLGHRRLIFCLGIIVLFTGLGFLVTAIAGPFGVVQLGSSPWVNGFIALVFLVFGLSLLGAFELGFRRAAYEAGSCFARRRLRRHAANGIDLFVNFFCLYRTNRWPAADCVRPAEGLAAGARHDELRDWSLRAFLPAGVVSVIPARSCRAAVDGWSA